VKRGKLVAWLVLVGVLSALAYTSRLVGGKPPRDALYQYGLALSGLFEYAVLFGIVYWIARGLSREELGLRRPRSWSRAAGLMIGLLILVVVAEQLLEAIFHAAREQGLEPTHWEPKHATAFALNAFVVVVIAPFVEELTFRGLGFAVLWPFGAAVAVVGTAAAFAAVHGLVDGFVPLLVFGLAIGFLRLKTESVYPGMLFHGFFNATALAIAFAH
jgi:membrane protease YdiL (CAAX protease family)